MQRLDDSKLARSQGNHDFAAVTPDYQDICGNIMKANPIPEAM